MGSQALELHSAAAAKSLADRIRRAIPSAKVQVRPDNSLRVIVHPETLTPSQARLVGGCEVVKPEPPAGPLFKRKSTVPRGVGMEIARRIMGELAARGDAGNRQEFLRRAIAAGLTRNTASTYYPRLRIEHGLPHSVRETRQRAAVVGAPPPRKALTARQVRNGVTEPLRLSNSAAVWRAATAFFERERVAPTPAQIRAEVPRVPKETIRHALKTWRQFHAISPTGGPP